MSRIPRGQVAGHAYHSSIGERCATAFHKEDDYSVFLDFLATESPPRKVACSLFPFLSCEVGADVA